MSRIERKSKIEFVALGKMQVSELAQREVRDYRVDALVSSFDPDRLGHPVLNFRSGRYFIMDGQHRIAAVKRWIGAGWEDSTIECQVFRGLSESDEAEMFLRLNDTLNVSAFDKFKKAVAAGRPTENAIDAAVLAQGLHISKRKTPGSVSAVSALVKVFKRSDAATLGRALRIIRDAYGDSGFDSFVIDGIGHLCHRYNGAIDEQSVKEKLGNARGGVKGLLNKANTIHLNTGNAKPQCIAAAAVEIINQGRGGGKLPSWWKVEA